MTPSNRGRPRAALRAPAYEVTVGAMNEVGSLMPGHGRTVVVA
jgi:hypothetical protein